MRKYLTTNNYHVWSNAGYEIGTKNFWKSRGRNLIFFARANGQKMSLGYHLIVLKRLRASIG